MMDWEFLSKALVFVYPDHKKSILPKDILIFTSKFLCDVKTEYDDLLKIIKRISCVKEANVSFEIGGYYNYRIRYKKFFLNDKEHGESKGWYINGQIRWHDFYKNGKRHGESTDWNENGKITQNTYFVNGKRISGTEGMILFLRF